MATSKMPRRFWSYTAGKGDAASEERDAAREQWIQFCKETGPGLLAFLVILLLTGLIFLMILAEFRGFYLDQIRALFTPR